MESLFEILFGKKKESVVYCAECLCKYCANNVEEMHSTVRPAEQREPCFNCDDCFEYHGDHKYKHRNKDNCSKFVLSDFGAKKKRKTMKVYK